MAGCVAGCEKLSTRKSDQARCEAGCKELSSSGNGMYRGEVKSASTVQTFSNGTKINANITIKVKILFKSFNL